MKQTCGVCGKEIETGGMGAAPMCEHYKSNHPEEFFGTGEVPPKYRKYGKGWPGQTHPDPGDQAAITDFA
jgi:hypothetical protein